MKERAYISKNIKIPVWLFVLSFNFLAFLAGVGCLRALMLMKIYPDNNIIPYQGLFCGLAAIGIALFKNKCLEKGAYLENPETKKGTYISQKEYKTLIEFDSIQTAKKIRDTEEERKIKIEEEFARNLAEAMQKLELIK